MSILCVNEETVYINDDRDFISFIEEKLGKDARDYVLNLYNTIYECNQTIVECNKEYGDLYNLYSKLKEENERLMFE